MIDEFTHEPRIGYFSMEIALHNEIRTYAGGLGGASDPQSAAWLPSAHAMELVVSPRACARAITSWPCASRPPCATNSGRSPRREDS